jgi:hypothetical protein
LSLLDVLGAVAESLPNANLENGRAGEADSSIHAQPTPAHEIDDQHAERRVPATDTKDGIDRRDKLLLCGHK